MKRKIRVLFFIPTFSSGGAEAFVVNQIEKINKEKFTPELLCIDTQKGVYNQRLDAIGVKIIALVENGIDNPVKRYLAAYRAFRVFLLKNRGKYDVIHFNIAQGEELPFIHMSKKYNIPIRILHSHNSSVNSKAKYYGHLLCRAIFQNDSTDYLACSDIAAKWLIPKKNYIQHNYKIIKNGIDVETYRYNNNKRISKRNELGIGNAPVFINIGRLNHQKNQSFLIEAFQQIHNYLPEAILLVAGEGELRGELEKKAEQCKVNKSIMWLGNRCDIPDLLSAADVFLLPSLFEGLPFTIIEAQASGIQCVISNTISDECAITDIVERVPLEKNEYAKSAVAAFKRANNNDRNGYYDLVRKSGFDINQTISEMEHIYESKVKKS